MARKPLSTGVIADVSVRLFKIAARFVSRDPHRENISGVFLQPHPKRGCVLVATDAHRILILHDEHGSCRRSMTLSVKGLKIAQSQDKSTRESETRWQVREGKNKPRKGERCVPLVNLLFPKWLHIAERIAATRGGSTPAVNPIYLADFARAAKELQHGPYPSICLVPGETAHDELLILFPDAPHAVGVLMPMRIFGAGDLPAFLEQMLAGGVKQKGEAA